MPRYLTPSKIALLALVSIYAQGSVPKASTVQVLSLLLRQIVQNSSRNALALPTSNAHAIPIETFERELGPLASSFPGRSMWDLLLKKLWSLNCSDALDSFLTSITTYLAKTKAERDEDRKNGIAPDPPISKHLSRIARASPIGAFIRRAYIEYIRLQFHDAITLWESFVAYRLPTRQAWEKRNSSQGRSSFDSNLAEFGLDASNPLTQIVYRNVLEEDTSQGGFSAFDTERLLEFQSRDRTFYQYALLNLAILQADFGCYSEVIPAMKEAISTARENKDMPCLNFCMSWLYHFGKAYPSEMKEIQKSGMLGTELEGLQFLKAKAKESEMWSLLVTSLLSEAKLGLQTLVQGGRFQQALDTLEDIPQNILRVLKYQQYWGFFIGLVRLRRLLHRGDLTAAAYLHSKLEAQGTPDIEVTFTLSLLHIDLLTRQGDFAAALSTLENLATPSSSHGSTDVLAHIKLLNLKARILHKCGQTLKGFSISVRACNLANNSRLLPALWESIGILSTILNTLSEFEAAAQLLEAVAPQVHECEDWMAGQAESESTARVEQFRIALGLIDTSLESWARIEDTAGQCEMLAKKAVVLRLLGDLERSDDATSRLSEVCKKAEESFVDAELAD
ncbi:MAG: hypothetical protein Q9227_006525 [Pyrenula ochraceoflavens]